MLRTIIAARLPALILGVLLLFPAGCAANPSDSQTSDTTKPTRLPSAFTLDVLPLQFNGHTIAGQLCVFLVTIRQDAAASDEPVTLMVDAVGAEVPVKTTELKPGEVAEIVVIPLATAIGRTIQVTFSGKRSDSRDSRTITAEVVDGIDDRRNTAGDMQGVFLTWLASEHPELNIGPATRWNGTLASPQWLVVSHYLFFSDEWEMHLEWHNMIPPHDWVRIDLRRRGKETVPSLAFEISSWTARSTPKPIEVPNSVWR
ncbi:MAG: hypothetical protein M0P55_10630 [Clostridiales bacterium]|nr:hypothetical protein [Clostridiales bacterium]